MMVGAGAFALVIVILVILAMLYYNSEKKVSMYEKKDTFIIKAVNKVNKLSTKFVSEKLELDKPDDTDQQNTSDD
jgi:hypothetical protein